MSACRFLRRALIPAVVSLLWAGAAMAQLASVEVTVSTADGLPVADVAVELANQATAFSATSAANAGGRARFAAVPAGPGYEVRVGGQALAAGIRLRANEARAVAVSLAPPEVQVTARRATTAVNTLNAEVSAGLRADALMALPVEARDLNRALVRLPNVVPSTGFFPEAPSISINGANGLFTQYLIDGLDNNENFLGGPKFPVSTGFVEDVTVLTSSYSVEYGRTGNGVVNVTSRSGSNDWQGELFYLTRPGQPLDSSSPFAGRDLSGNAVRDGFERQQVGIGGGGALVADRSFLYGNLEYTKDDKDNLLNSPDLGVVTTVPGTNESLLASLKLDHRLDDRWWLSFRANRGDVQVERQGGGLDGGVTFPSAGSRQERQSTLLTATALYDGDAFTAETGLGYYRFDWDYGRPLGGAGPQVTVQGPDTLPVAVLGNPGFVFDSLEETWQLKQKFTISQGMHQFRVGFDLLRADFRLAGGGNPAGNYTVRLSEEELLAVAGLGLGSALQPTDLTPFVTDADQIISYAVELRPASFGRHQNLTGLYVEDQMALTADLTVTAGLRWDYDSVSRAGGHGADTDNFAPRLAVNYRLTGDIAVRGGAGLFYDKLPYAVLSDALQQNTTSAAFQVQLGELVELGLLPADTNLERATFDGNLTVNPACTTYLECPTGADSPDLRDTTPSNERRILSPDGLENPYTWQFSLGSQWQVSDLIVASADLIYTRSHKQLRLRDLNAPPPFALRAPTADEEAELQALGDAAARAERAADLGLIQTIAQADALRPAGVPDGGARRIVVSETAGRAEYRALNLRLRKDQGIDWYGYQLSYTLAKLENDTDDINFQAANFNDFTVENGPSVNDRRHVISGIVFLYPGRDLTFSVAGLFQSGQPVNLIPDAGIFGTTDLNGDGSSFSDAYLGNSDRAPGVTRNSGRLDWASTVDLGLRWTPRVRGLAGSDARLEFSADVFNVFNANNESGFANAATQSNQIQVFGQPFVQRNAGAPRQYQFGARYLF